MTLATAPSTEKMRSPFRKKSASKFVAAVQAPPITKRTVKIPHQSELLSDWSHAS